MDPHDRISMFAGSLFAPNSTVVKDWLIPTTMLKARNALRETRHWRLALRTHRLLAEKRPAPTIVTSFRLLLHEVPLSAFSASRLPGPGASSMGTARAQGPDWRWQGWLHMWFVERCQVAWLSYNFINYPIYPICPGFPQYWSWGYIIYFLYIYICYI